MSTSRIATLVAERRGDDWSAHDSRVPLSAADPATVATARTMLGLPIDRPRGTDTDILRHRGLVTPENTFTNAGALLCTDRLDSTDHMVYLHRRSAAGALTVTERLAGPLLGAIRRLFDLLAVRVERTSVNLPGGGQQLQVPDLPDTASSRSSTRQRGWS